MSRENTLALLKKYIKKEAKEYEEYIHSQSLSYGEYYDEIYREISFQVLYDFLKEMNNKIILDNLKNNKYSWNSSIYETIKNRIKEQDEFLNNPFEVEEGVLQCRCGSKRVFSYSKQVRSSDEKTTIFAQCIECKKKWKE